MPRDPAEHKRIIEKLEAEIAELREEAARRDREIADLHEKAAFSDYTARIVTDFANDGWKRVSELARQIDEMTAKRKKAGRRRKPDETACTKTILKHKREALEAAKAAERARLLSPHARVTRRFEVILLFDVEEGQEDGDQAA